MALWCALLDGLRAMGVGVLAVILSRFTHPTMASRHALPDGLRAVGVGVLAVILSRVTHPCMFS
ncbi:hypothetical protein D3C72_2480770 [compost metagenome]